MGFHTGCSVLASAGPPPQVKASWSRLEWHRPSSPPDSIVRRWQMQILEEKGCSTPPAKTASCFHEKKKFLKKKKKRSATENRSQHCLHNPRVLSSWPWGIWMGDNKVTYLIETGYSLTVLEHGPGCTQGSEGSYKLGEEMLPRKPNWTISSQWVKGLKWGPKAKILHAESRELKSSLTEQVHITTLDHLEDAAWTSHEVLLLIGREVVISAPFQDFMVEETPEWKYREHWIEADQMLCPPQPPWVVT